MASFTALNIEPDDQSDDEVDNTKELQIEEALKLYQIALKLHSQGPKSYPQAADAYSNLLKSEIFKYPESITEFARIDEHPELEFAEASFAPLDLVAAGSDGPSTLPQILYLSHKNHGQFILDCVKSHLQYSNLPLEQVLKKDQLDYQAKAALGCFALALASDESDTELWRRAARVGATLGSRRIARYCLEAAVEVDDDPTYAEVEPQSLEEGFAGEQLKEHLQVLSDDTSLSHPIMDPFRKKNMAPFILKGMDPYAYLPDPTKTLEVDMPRNEITMLRIVLEIPLRSWTALGDAICVATISPDGLLGKGISIRFPPEDAVTADETVVISTEDQVMQDVGTTDSPIGGSNGTPGHSTIIAGVEEEPVQVITTTTIVPLSDIRQRAQSTSLPTRKRSQSAAGIRDTPEDDNGAQKRSKRIRNRDTTSEVDPSTQFAEQLQNFVRADTDVFAFVGDLLSKIGDNALGTFPDLEAVLSQEMPSDRADVIDNTATRDVRDILRSWDDDKASTFVNASSPDLLGFSAGGANAGLAAFLENSKSGPLKQSTKPPLAIAVGLDAFAQKVDAEWMPLQDVIWEWVCEVLPSYESTVWPEDFKISVVRMISFDDPDIYLRIQHELLKARKYDVNQETLGRWGAATQSLFELHLDIYSRITNPSSIVNYETRVMTKDRLDRWADLAADVIRSRSTQVIDELSLRYLWASVFYATMAENVSREHKVLCWSDLQAILEDKKTPIIELPNNAVMPEISIAAAEREVSRLTTMDFFFNLFQTDTSNPLAIIETLEPVLDPDSTADPEATENEGPAVLDTATGTPAALREMWKFLRGGSTSLRLFLWSRLREAYFSLDYPTKIFSCYLRALEVIVADLHSDDYVDSAEGPRHHQLLLWLKALDDLLVKSLTIALNDGAKSFDIIDDRHLRTTCAALAKLNRMLHAAALFDDEVRVGSNVLPQTVVYGPHGSFTVIMTKLREMQVRTWALQYCMVKEAMSQNTKIFQNPDKDLADFLALVHYSLGLRRCCKASNKIFLKMMKVEMIRMKHVERWEDYLGQVLYDLYGIHLGIGTYLLDDHGCPPENLDKRTVLNIAEQVIELAGRMSMKDLLKHELRTTIEKMQTAIGPAKSTPQMQHNLRNLTEYLKTSIRPLHIYQALKAQVEIDSVPVVTADSVLAEKGWYFLQGMIALTKFRAQKRVGPGGQTDDMKVAATFMRLQLQYSSDHWETWYRLAQCFDYELEDEIMWTAEKINNDRPTLVRLQRSAIHCYIMALSTAMRSADDSPDTMSKIGEMYHDFGTRLYTSSREPFSMEAFYVDEFEKHMSGSGEVGMYKQPLHKEMNRFMVWQYAAELFRRSAARKPGNWMTHFMLGKCRWKMFTLAIDPSDRNPPTKPAMDSVLAAFVKAIETVPKPRDSRQEPILEPHYKLVSIVHKLVSHAVMEPQAGADLLQEQPYAIQKGEHVDIGSLGAWEPFVLESFRYLRSADKQHWHHRMIARVAGILWDENNADQQRASAAGSEFRESMFTKTMHIQVWKPEVERPGRHCVYMQRYVQFMVKLLWITDDKQGMEGLVKRVRKKANDFYQFTKVWTDCVSNYLRLIRSHSGIPPNIDELFKSVPHEEFEMYSDRLQDWIADPASSHKALDALREAAELKKLNASSMKTVTMDDMINDAWAALYLDVAKGLPGPEPSSLQQAQLDGVADSAPSRSVMSLNNLVMNMDGTQIPVPVTIAGASDSAGRQRKVGILRREVLRRAETAINRASEVQRPVAGPKVRNSISETPAALILGSNAPPLVPERQGSASEEKAEEASQSQIGNEEAGKDERMEREESSAPGSVHDSADDESDLSDVPEMDEAEQAQLFPGLMTTGSSGAA